MNTPRLSIGLPVFNGERYLEESITAIVSQSFTDFELIISDNASTDRTQQICLSCAARDLRVRYYRNERNIGGGNNFNRTFLLSRGEYFQWSTYDDKCGPEYLARCIAILDEHPEVVLAFSRVMEIDADGNHIGIENTHEARSEEPYERFRTLTSLEHSCQAIYGVIRSDVLRKTLLWLNHTDSDRTLLAELSLRGQFYQIQDPLFFRRNYSGNSIRRYPDWRERMEWFEPAFRERLVCPHWAQLLGYCRIIIRTPLSRYQQFRCFVRLAEWLTVDRRVKYMAKDLVLAGLWLGRSLLRPKARMRPLGEEFL
ncbi:MAG TPA: glycosyltransferase [Bacteroidota bacterium]|nr:glycosyltransferase [Bacteroidota bacterium]